MRDSFGGAGVPAHHTSRRPLLIRSRPKLEPLPWAKELPSAILQMRAQQAIDLMIQTEEED